jgi:hypothetical protein
MGRKKSSAPAKPHSRKKSAARDVAALTLDEQWAAGVRDSLLADCHPWQRDAVLDPARRVSMLVGRGGGKTTVLRVRALIKMTSIPRARIIYAATSRPEAERLNWEPLKELIDQLGLRDEFTFNEGKLRCTCKRTGATYQLVGIDDKKEVNKYRGQPFNEVQVDETASHDTVLLEMFLDRAVGPRLGERNGCIVLAGTPGHILYGRFYDVTRKGSELHRPYRDRELPEFKNWIKWSSHAWNMLDVLALPNAAARYPALLLNWEAALVEKERQCWSDQNPIWMREYLGLWARDDTTSMYAYRARDEHGALFNRWEPLAGRKLEGVAQLEAAIAALPDLDDERAEWFFGYGIDLGARDPFALNIAAFSPTDPRRHYYHVFSFERRRMHPRKIAELLIGPEAVATILRGDIPEEFGGLFGLTGWPIAIVADLAGLGETVIDALAEEYGIKIRAAEKKGKHGAIEVVNGDLVDQRASIMADTPLEEQMSSLQWKPDEYGHPKEDKAAANHSADSWTYIRTELGAMFSAAPPPADEPAEEGDRPAPTKAEAKAKKRAAPTAKDTWDDKPVRSKRKGGEFNALLQNSNFSHIR